MKITSFIMALSVIFSLSACQRTTPPTTNLVDELYQHQDTFAGDNVNVVSIIDKLPTFGLKRGLVELKTEKQPYRINIQYLTDNRVAVRPEIQEYISEFAKNAAIMLSLIPNAEEVLIEIDDAYGNIAGGYYTRDNAKNHLQTEQISADIITNAAENAEAFADFYKMINSIKFEPAPTSPENEKIYEVISEDEEIVINSGMHFGFAADSQNADMNEFARQNDIDIAKYDGQELIFIVYAIENYKTKELSPYMFVFTGDELAAYKNLETSENERAVRDILISLEDR